MWHGSAPLPDDGIFLTGVYLNSICLVICSIAEFGYNSLINFLNWRLKSLHLICSCVLSLVNLWYISSLCLTSSSVLNECHPFCTATLFAVFIITESAGSSLRLHLYLRYLVAATTDAS
ncbi:putative membrane protein [Escherichia coli 3-373-03_S1_C1]|nr:putative membrane protein [Escherichia coli 3-373-03_S1_C2]KDU34593.1 putative membrane protein [Escherichia coli 3-373-03_S1_C3]KDU43033.1 putative membrane protein [Escherichia coli 3-373-03_S1_C1]